MRRTDNQSIFGTPDLRSKIAAFVGVRQRIFQEVFSYTLWLTPLPAAKPTSTQFDQSA
jgi:hypothetical protein